MLAALCGIVSLAVDFGRVQVAKAELRQAADAAARFGAAGLANGGNATRARSNAIAAAADNKVDGQSLSLAATDVEVGTWANGTFSPGGASPNAVRVAASRGAVPLVFARLIGISSASVDAVSIARVNATPPVQQYGLVGLDAINMTGNASIDSYDSSAGLYSLATRRTNGDIASNGNVGLTGNATVYGDVFRGSGKSVSLGGNAAVVSPGTTKTLTQPLAYPPASLPQSYTSLGNFNGNGNGTTALPSGDYYLTGFSLSGNHTLAVNGKVTLYVAGEVDLSGNVFTSGNKPANLKIVVIGSGEVKLTGNADLYADIYAPQSTVKLAGNGQFFGRAIGKTLDVSGNGKLHFDETLGPANPNEPSVATMSISTVQ